jgi:hypothetical protein
MSWLGCRQFHWLGVAALAAIIATGENGRAQDDFDAVDEVEANPAGMVFIRQQQPGIEQFEQWVFNRMGGAGIARNRLSAALELHIDEINRFCGMTDDQKRKLHLAGRGDIKRFFDRIDEAKRRYLLVMNDQNHNVWQDVQPLQTALNVGIFGSESIFAKTVKTTLSDEQAAMLAEHERRRNQNRYLVTIDWFVAHVDKGLGMTAKQRKGLADLLKETPPPRRFGSSDYYYLMYRTSQISEDRIKPIFDDIQWRIFSMQLNQARGMRQWLMNNGMIADEPVAGPDRNKLAEAARRGREAKAKANAIKAEARKQPEEARKK